MYVDPRESLAGIGKSLAPGDDVEIDTADHDNGSHGLTVATGTPVAITLARMTQIRPFLMFQGAVAASAIDLYLTAFPDGRVVSSQPHPDPSQGIMLAELELAGQKILVSDSAVDHAFDFTPSSSLFVDVTERDELERLVELLGEGGGVLMPLGDYGFSQAFAWVNDRFGVSWQLNLQ